jgi:hypothetical protein
MTPLAQFTADAVETSFHTACRNGWHDREHLPLRSRTDIAAKLALISSEVTEAYHAWLDANREITDDVLLELADVCIRSYDLLGALDARMTKYPAIDVHPVDDDDFPTHLLDMYSAISEALEYMRKKEYLFPDVTESAILGVALFTVSVAHHYGHDLLPFITRKMEYNALRTYRHGGKML